MRLLLVEDEPSFVEGLVPRLLKIGTGTDVLVAGSRDSALEHLQNGFFDLIILDLKIPTKDGASDAEVDHGYRVFIKALDIAPGTPVFILTGSSTEPLVPDLLKQAHRKDFWGDRKEFSTVSLLPKSRIPEFLEQIAGVETHLQALKQIEIASGGKPVNLSPQERRIIKIFTRRREGVKCAVSELSGGFSGSRVLRLKVDNANGALQIDAAGKIAAINDVLDESKRYDEQVVRLAPGAFPTLVEVLTFGAKSTAGIFYSLLRGYEASFFDRLIVRDAGIEKLTDATKDIFKLWREGVPVSQMTVRDVRRRLVSDDLLSQLAASFNLKTVHDLEERKLQVRTCCIHGDLHGANILVDSSNHPMVIDFGDVGPGPSALDPITLELSIYFHPAAAGRFVTPRTAGLVASWHDVDKYASGHDIAGFFKSCRKWAHEVAAGDREVYACAYAYVLRQLKYPETNKDVAMALLQDVMTVMQATYAQ